MTLTLSTARAALLDFLDDDGTRWSTTAQDTALAWALSTCLREYVGAGGERFNIEAAKTSDSSGLIDLSSDNPLVVRGLTMVVGNRNFPLAEIAPEQRNLTDTVARSFNARYVKDYALPTDTTHPLVGTGATAAPSWDAFDHWIAVRAAIYASTKDADARPDLQSLEQRARDAVMLNPIIPTSIRFPGPATWYAGWFTWYWRPDTKKIQICKRL